IRRTSNGTLSVAGININSVCDFLRKHLISEHFEIMSVLVDNMLRDEHIPYFVKRSLFIFDSLRLYWNDLEGATSCNWNSTTNYRRIGIPFCQLQK
ncbi:MAG: hypothetical protein ACXABY_18015, partial [Candidatus Thorarchaeota archaeon]